MFNFLNVLWNYFKYLFFNVAAETIQTFVILWHKFFNAIAEKNLLQHQSTVFSLHFSSSHHLQIIPWLELLSSDKTRENHKVISLDRMVDVLTSDCSNLKLFSMRFLETWAEWGVALSWRLFGMFSGVTSPGCFSNSVIIFFHKLHLFACVFQKNCNFFNIKKYM